jgi:hypothetical protein
LSMSTHVASSDVEPDQLHDARPAWVDVQHQALTCVARWSGFCIQPDRASHHRLKDNTPGDAELSGEVVGAGSKDDAADGCVGECTDQVGDGAHRGLQLTVVAGHKLHGVQPGSVVVAGLGAGQHGARERWRHHQRRPLRRRGWHPNGWRRRRQNQREPQVLGRRRR